jgi:hypothetical protein
MGLGMERRASGAMARLYHRSIRLRSATEDGLTRDPYRPSMAKTPPSTSGKTAEREAAAGAVALAGGGNGPAVAAQPVQLANDPRSATAMSSDAITVIAAQSQIDSRAAQLQAKLTALGIDDVSEEGKLILGGAVAITPGLRKGVEMSGTVIATSEPIDLAAVPEMSDYTRAGRLASTGTESLAVRGTTVLPAAGACHPRLGQPDGVGADHRVVGRRGPDQHQIGERLYISRRTVESHLGRLGKLGLSTRGQLVSAAVRHAAGDVR